MISFVRYCTQKASMPLREEWAYSFNQEQKGQVTGVLHGRSMLERNSWRTFWACRLANYSSEMHMDIFGIRRRRTTPKASATVALPGFKGSRYVLDDSCCDLAGTGCGDKCRAGFNLLEQLGTPYVYERH